MIYSASISYPNIFSSSRGKTTVKTAFDAINNRLSLLLQSAYTELLGDPDFGCGLYEMTFEYADDSTYLILKDMISEAITKYEPSIEVNKEDIKIEFNKLNNHIEITITYRMRGSDLYNSTNLNLNVEGVK